jgi:PH (Pleckstrin Homology) domain-containing protein
VKPFRPRRARVVAIWTGVVGLVLFGGLAVLLPQAGAADRAGIVLFGLVIAGFMWRYASLSATPTSAGLTVRNLLTTRRLEWAEVVDVHLVVGAPWVTLDLSDGDSLAVMAIQKADGEYGRGEASRLAGLVAAHAAPEPEPPKPPAGA